jgi:predicted LPLAT superfamily acyltransferase
VKQAWLDVPERSNRFWLRTITWIALRLGRSVASFLLYPISAYFVVFSDRTRTASRDFLRRALGRDCGWLDVFRHYHTFACSLLDRIYVFAGQDHRLDLRVHGLEVLEQYAGSGRSCLLVGAHLGGWEIVRAVGRLRRGFRVKALVYGERTPLITGLFRKLNPALFEDIVYMGEPGSLVGLDEHAREGSLIAILGDRSMHGDKRVRCDFLGEPAWFPEAPALLSRILDVPLVLFVCLHRGDGCYDVWFEHLAEPPRGPRGERDRAVRETMQRYARRLEHYCRLAPYNWFNFHDFWQSDD